MKRGDIFIAKADFAESKAVKVLKLEIKDTKRSVHFYDIQGDRRFITTTGKVFFEMFYMEG